MGDGYAGSIELTIGGIGETSFVQSQRSTGSWRVLRPVISSYPGASIGIVGQSAGLMGGDRQTLSAAVSAGAWGTIFPVAAELILPGERPAEQLMHIHIQEGGRLVWLAEPVIPYPQSRLKRNVCVRRTLNTTFIMEEIIMAGRLARNERFLNVSLDTTLRIVQDDELSVFDHLQVDPESASCWGGFDGYLSVILCSPRISQVRWDNIGESDDIFWGWTELKPQGCVVIRALGTYPHLNAFVTRIRREYHRL